MAAASRLGLALASLGAWRADGAEAEVPWTPGLQGTTFWDCNGAGCDSKVLMPFQRELFSYAPHYAPMVPDTPGGTYGESLWITGAASDSLTDRIGEDTPCCGVGAGCGRCLLVRNPSAQQWNWTAVVMKKSRCPPESKGCEVGMLHMDFAVPGFEFLTESTANVCGDLPRRRETYLTKEEAGACMPSSGLLAADESGACCEALPNATVEQRRLQQGCKAFAAWGWQSGAPLLEYQPVACPQGFASRIGEAFGSSGVRTLERPSYRWYILGCLIIVLTCCTIAVVNRIVDRRQAKKKYAEMEARRKRKQHQHARSKSNTEYTDSRVDLISELEESESSSVE